MMHLVYSTLLDLACDRVGHVGSYANVKKKKKMASHQTKYQVAAAGHFCALSLSFFTLRDTHTHFFIMSVFPKETIKVGL